MTISFMPGMGGVRNIAAPWMEQAFALATAVGICAPKATRQAARPTECLEERLALML